MKRFLLFVFCCISVSVSAQDLTGIWRGNFRSSTRNRMMEMLGQDERYKFEVQVDQQGKKFSGVTYSYLTTVFYGKATCEGTVNPKTKKVLLEEIKIVEQRMSGGGDVCIMTLFLQYTKMGDEEFLEGTYSSIKTRDSTDCGKGTVFLRKVVTSDFYKEPFLVEREKEGPKKPVIIDRTDSSIVKNTPPVTKPSKPTTNTGPKPPVKKPATNPIVKKNTPAVKKPPVTTQPPVVKTPEKPIVIDSTPQVQKPVVKAPPLPTPKILLTRENELVKTINTNVKEIVIRIYDNGTVDNDTISVYLDKKLVLSKQRLSEKALTLTIKLNDDENYHELVMVAENLGEIPPNTSLMIVDLGKTQQEVRITSTEQKNAVVIFKYNH